MVAQGVPWLLGGSADLASSCLTVLKFDGIEDFMAPQTGWGTYKGRNFHFGIREHAMGSICNGMAVSRLRPFCSTFMVFSDYMKPPIRMSAIMEIPSIWVFTHDSIGVGEDGPTHQPIEQLAALRSIPGLYTFRPADANETLEMWKTIIPLTHEPAAVVLSRQALPTIDRTKYGAASGLSKGAYILADSDGPPQAILMATGSEVALMLQAHEKLKSEGVAVRSISMPCLELFKHQSLDYQQSVLPDSCRARVSIEAATRDTWGSYIGLDGEHIGMITFGASAPIGTLHKELGFTVDDVIAAARRVMAKNPRTLEAEASVARAWKRKRSQTALDAAV
jgi:transketolase